MELAIEAARQGLLVALQMASPILAVGMVVGLLISVFQAVTQVQEPTLASVPKLVAMAGTLVVLLPWLLAVIATYMQEVFNQLAVTSS